VSYVRFDVPTAIKMMFWVVTPWRLYVDTSPDDGDSMFLRNVGYLPTSLYRVPTHNNNFVINELSVFALCYFHIFCVAARSKPSQFITARQLFQRH
jgi:hypothetical protein